MSGTDANSELSQETTHASDGAPDVALGSAARPPFRWGKFFTALATFGIVVAVIGVGALFALGQKPLEARAEKLVQATPPKVVIVWPQIARPKAPEPAKAATSPAPDKKTPAPKSDAKGKQATPAERTENSGIVLAENKPQGPTTWLPAQFQQELLLAAEEAAAHALKGFRPDPLAAVGKVMESSGWFVGRPTVELRGENTIYVSGTWRLPLAVVRVADRDRLTSWEAFPMPPEYLAGKSGLPIIEGASIGPALAAGGAIDFSQRWPSDDVPAAVELLATLHREKWYGLIAGVDVSEFATSHTLWLVTTQKTRVLWGGPASRPLLGETTTATKVARLSEIYRRFGRIDAGRQKIDISGSHPVEINISATGAGVE
jgi:hypothetical protein